MKPFEKNLRYLYILACPPLLGAAVVIQSYHTLLMTMLAYGIEPFGACVGITIQHSAVFALKPQGAKFMEFVTAVVPSGGHIVIVPGNGRAVFRSKISYNSSLSIG